MKKNLILISLFVFLCCMNIFAQKNIWSSEYANKWYSNQNWLIGCNFITSNAINQIEMWQEETFDPATIDKELGYAQKTGFNSMRVFLHYLVWQKDSTAYLKRIDQYLTIASKHNISTMFVFFDDCWNGFPRLGDQPLPKPFTHNSGWVQCPGKEEVTDVSLFPLFESYIKGIITHFNNDSRIVMWDLYNEPGNSGHGDETITLLKSVFKWARDVRPTQPLTAGVWEMSSKFSKLNRIQIDNSDIISFHNYGEITDLQSVIDSLKKFNKPLICSEYMRRPVSNFLTHLSLLKKNNIAAYNWGLVSGKTQTIYPWDSWQKNYDAEPKIWFHDVFRKDGTPYSPEETNLILELSKNK